MTSARRPPDGPTPMDNQPRKRFVEVLLAFLKLGFTAFGGPAAHVALMQEEFVHRRKWIDNQRFLDLLAATNLIPGPNSTEMAIHLGFIRAGWPGLFAGGLGFALPAILMMMPIAWMYARFGTTPQAGWLLIGVQPVIIVVIFQALLNLGKQGIRTVLTALIALTAMVLYLLGVNEVLLMLVGGLLVMLVRNRKRFIGSLTSVLAYAPLLAISIPAASQATFSYTLLFLIFLKVGSILYGSGYVLLAFLRADLVERLGWLTTQQLIDAIAVGQVTPGPLFTSATFIGYQLGGVEGAVLASVGIFLPSFVFVALSSPHIPKMRSSSWLGPFLDGIIAASLGLMAGVLIQIAINTFTSPFTIVAALASAFLILNYKINSTWLILAGALAGFLAGLFL